MDGKQCPKCGQLNTADAVFCKSCGTRQQQFSQFSGDEERPLAASPGQNYGQTRPTTERPTVSQPHPMPYSASGSQPRQPGTQSTGSTTMPPNPYRPAQGVPAASQPGAYFAARAANMTSAEARDAVEHSVKRFVTRFAGEEENQVDDIKLSSLFSEIPKRHSRQQAEELFICGTSKTTPNIMEIDNDNGSVKPWLFSRVLVWFVVAFALSYFGAMAGGMGDDIILIIVSAAAVPVSGLVFFFETNVLRNISFFIVMKVFIIGGLFSSAITMVLYAFTDLAGSEITLGMALTIGVVEELGKMSVVTYYVYKLDVNNVLNGLLLGAAVGAGFASIETTGYIANSEHELSVAFLRAWSALGGHLIWAAMVGAGLVLAKKGAKKLSADQIFRPEFLAFFACAVVLHAVWDWHIVESRNAVYIKLVILIVIGWAIILPLISIGLRQVSREKTNYVAAMFPVRVGAAPGRPAAGPSQSVPAGSASFSGAVPGQASQARPRSSAVSAGQVNPNPANTVNPVNPNPANPVNPNPANAMNPANAVNSANPLNPLNSENPANVTNPMNPMSPTYPEATVNSAAPVSPVIPPEAATAVNPVQQAGAAPPANDRLS